MEKKLFERKNTRVPYWRSIVACGVMAVTGTGCSADLDANTAVIVRCGAGAAAYKEKGNDKIVASSEAVVDRAEGYVGELNRRLEDAHGSVMIADKKSKEYPSEVTLVDQNVVLVYHSKNTGNNDFVYFGVKDGKTEAISPGAIVCNDDDGMHPSKTFTGLEYALDQTQALAAQ